MNKDAHQFTAGNFSLAFDPSGKLEQLRINQRHAVLFAGDYRMHLGADRFFAPAGWDECFPTIEPYGTEPLMGRLIGVAPAQSNGGATYRQVWTTADHAVERCFAGNGMNQLRLTFQARNTARQPLDFLWASHAVFNFDLVKRIELPDGVCLTDLACDGSTRKYFIAAGRPIRIVKAGLVLSLETDQPYWGIWLNRGGWPAANPAGFGCLGLEATNCAADQPDGRSVLAPGALFAGAVTVTIEEAKHDDEK